MLVSQQSVEELFAEVCLSFFEIVLRLFRIGLLPEIHGQNSILIWNDGRVTGILLRDHDAVRLHLPWLTAQGIADPEYQTRPGYSNSLYNETPKKLLFYLQTLVIQVNLYAIIEVLASVYNMKEASLWTILQKSLDSCFNFLPKSM